MNYNCHINSVKPKENPEEGYFFTSATRYASGSNGFNVQSTRSAYGSSSNPSDFSKALDDTFGNKTTTSQSSGFATQSYERPSQNYEFSNMKPKKKDSRQATETQNESFKIEETIVDENSRQVDLFSSSYTSVPTTNVAMDQYDESYTSMPKTMAPMDATSRMELVKNLLNANTGDEELAVIEKCYLSLKKKRVNKL